MGVWAEPVTAQLMMTVALRNILLETRENVGKYALAERRRGDAHAEVFAEVEHGPQILVEDWRGAWMEIELGPQVRRAALRKACRKHLEQDAA